MRNRTLIPLLAALLVVILAPSVNAAEHGITCSLEGAATIKPGLNMTDQDYKVTFSGDLSDCQSTGDETSGTVKAKVTASGTCGHATATGVAMVKWDTGAKTTVELETQDVGALVVLTFDVTKSNAEGLAEGDQGFGLLVFQADPNECNSEEGVTEATFNGQVGGGSPS